MNAIFAQDFRAASREKRTFALRSAIVSVPVLLLVFALVEMDRYEPSDTVGREMLGVMAHVLLALAMLIAPGLTASLLSEERRNNKLDVLRSAPVGAAAVVLGRWLSRVLHLANLLLPALAFSALSLLAGGVTLTLLARVGAMVLFTISWVSALGLACGASTRDVGKALLKTYAGTLFVALGPFLLEVLLWATIRNRGTVSFWRHEVLPLVSPFLAMEYARDLRFLPTAQADPLWIHGAFAIAASGIFLLVAIRALVREPRVYAARSERWLRRRSADPAPAPRLDDSGGPPGLNRPAGIATHQRGPLGPPRASVALEARSAAPPPSASAPPSLPFTRRAQERHPTLLDKNPALWLERRRGGRRRKTMRVLACILGALDLWLLFRLVTLPRSGAFRNFDVELVSGIGVLGSLLLAFLAVAGAGAAAFHRDGVSNTLDVLHSTPLPNHAIIAAKFHAALRPAVPWWLFSIAFVALRGFDAMSAASVIVYPFVSGILVAALAAFALVRSIRAPTAARATVRTFLGFIGLMCGVPLLISLVVRGGSYGFDLFELLIGIHPFSIALAAMLLERGPEPWMLGFALLYAAYLAYALVVRLPRAYEARRPDRDSAARPPALPAERELAEAATP